MVNRGSLFSSAYVGIAILIGVSALGLSTGSTSSEISTAREAPKQLIRQVVENELREQQEDNSSWRFRRTSREQGETLVYEVVDTVNGPLHRLISKNGVSLDPAQREQENSRIDHLISDPNELQKRAADEQNDVEEERRLVEMLPEAFDYRYADREGKLVKFTFTPDPSFKPRHREGEVFHHMTGTLWIDPVQKRIARIDGTLATEVKFGDGILGHLAKGGTFIVEQTDVGDGRWELTRLDVNMDGEALFFKTIKVRQNQQDSDFKPVPTDTSLQHAAELLKQGVPQPDPPAAADHGRGSSSFAGDKTILPANPVPTAEPKPIVFPKNMRNFA